MKATEAVEAQRSEMNGVSKKRLGQRGEILTYQFRDVCLPTVTDLNNDDLKVQQFLGCWK